MPATQLATPSSKDAVKISQSERAWIVALAVVCVALLSNLIVLFWGLNRGLDPDAESFYLVQYQNPYLYPTFSSFHLLLAKIPRLVSNEILHYRYLEVAARLLPALLLVIGVKTWANQWLYLSKLKTCLLAAFATLGASAVFCCFPRTISYNGLSSALITLAVAIVFFATSEIRLLKQQRSKPLLLALAGFLVSLCLFAKVTSAVVLLPCLCTFLFIQKGTRRDFGALIAGLAGGVVFFFAFVQGLSDWWIAFSETIKFELLTDHSPDGMAARALDFLRKHWWHGLVLLCVAIGLNKRISARSLELQQKFVRWLCIAFALLLLLSACALVLEPRVLISRQSLPAMGTLAFFALLLSSNRVKNWRLTSGVLLLLALPLIAAVGTNCSFWPHAASNMAAWFVLIMMAAFVCAEKFKAPYAMATVTAALALFSMTQFFEQYVYYRDDSLSLTAQTATTSKIPLLSGMRLQPGDIQFYEKAQEILTSNGFRQGDYILSLYDFPAIVYLLKAVSPGQSWYISWPERDEINAHYFRQAKLAEGQRMFMVLTGADPKKIVGPEMKAALLDPSLPLSKPFKRVGVLQHPRKPEDNVYFYASK